MRVWAESIPRILFSHMKWWRKPRWISVWMNNPGGASEPAFHGPQLEVDVFEGRSLCRQQNSAYQISETHTCVYLLMEKLFLRVVMLFLCNHLPLVIRIPISTI